MLDDAPGLSSAPTSGALPEPLRALIDADSARLARQRWRRWAVFAGIAVGVVAGMGLAGTPRAPAAGSGLHWAVLGGFALLGLGLSGLAFGLTLPSGRRLRPLLAVGPGLAGLLLALMASGDGPRAPLSHGAGCLLAGAVVAAALLGVAVALGRKVLRRHAPTGLLLGLGVGIIGLVPLHLGCPVVSLDHLLVWHGLVPVISGLGAGLLWALFEPT